LSLRRREFRGGADGLRYCADLTSGCFHAG
jgi:hypothetical protein